MAGFTSYSNTSSVKSPEFIADPNVPSVPDNTDLASRLNALDKTTGEIFDALMAAGKAQDAQALRTAITNMQRTGSELGINATARMIAIRQAETALNAAAMKTQNEILMQKAQAHAGTLNQLSNMRQQDFANAMTVYNAQKGRVERQQQDIANFNAQQADSARTTLSAFRNGGMQTRARTSGNTTPISPIMPSVPIGRSQASVDFLKNLNAEADMRKGLTAQVSGPFRNIYDPNYVQATMGNARFLKGATNYLGRPISNQEPNSGAVKPSSTWNARLRS
jgi:hypothetical protein